MLLSLVSKTPQRAEAVSKTQRSSVQFRHHIDASLLCVVRMYLFYYFILCYVSLPLNVFFIKTIPRNKEDKNRPVAGGIMEFLFPTGFKNLYDMNDN